MNPDGTGQADLSTTNDGDYSANWGLGWTAGDGGDVSPDADNNWNGFNFWVTKLDSTNPDAGDWKYNEMIEAFLDSIEYRARFEPLIP